MKPWWVITFLPKTDNFDRVSFTEHLDTQLLTWSLLSGALTEESDLRWWHIELFCPETEAEDENQLVDQIENFLYDPINPGNGKTPQIGGDIEAGELNIAIIGDLRCELTQRYLHSLAKMLRLKQEQVFPARTLNITALLYLPLNAHQLEDSERVAKFLIQLQTAMKHEIVAERPYNFVFILQETNAWGDNQDGGYLALTETQVKELFVQSLFHLMINQGALLDDLKNTHNTSYFSMGAAAIYYDWERHKQMQAQVLGESLVQNFKSAEQNPFVNPQEVERAVGALREAAEMRQLFQAFVFDEARPSFNFDTNIWENPKDSHGRSLSPWAMHRKELLYVYFFRHLKQLPFRLSEYARLFLSESMQTFRDFLVKRRGQIFQGRPERGERGLRQIIDETVFSVFKGEFGQARSIKQVRNVLDKIRQICNPTQVDSQLTSIDTFQKLEVFTVPATLREFHDRADETLASEREKHLYDRLVDTIRAHPIPLALFSRALLLAVLIAFFGERFLDYLSPNLLNLEWLLMIPGLALIILWAVPIALAFWRYNVRTLNAIQKQIKTYIGSILRHAQTQAKEQVRAEIAALFEQVKEYCDTVDEFLNTLSQKFNYPKELRRNYTSTVFQRFILEDVEIPGRGKKEPILSEVPELEIEVTGKRKRFSECNPEEQNSLLNQALNQFDPQSDSRRIIFQLLCDGFDTPSATQPKGLPNDVNDESLNSASGLWRTFAESLYDRVPQLHNLLLNDPDRIQQTIHRLRQLSYPAVAFHPGAHALPVKFEWQYSSCDEIKNFTSTDACNQIEGESILSLAGYRPIKDLSDIATIHAMRETVNFKAILWDDPASIFILATTKLEDADLPFFCAFDGSLLSAVAVQSKVIQLQQKLHIQPKDAEHLPV